MELNDAAVEELLGAYALDALDAGDVASVDEVLARRPDLAAEADRLTRAAAWLGAGDALESPPSLRDAVLARARERGIDPGADPATRAYVASSSRLRDTMEGLHPDEHAVDTPNGLAARDLVVHLAAQDSLVAQAVGRAVVPEVTEVDVDARTERFVERFRDRPVDEAIDVWLRASDAVAAWAGDASSGSTIEWLGLDLPRENVLVARAFENWIHRDDLRRVQGRAPEAPPAVELHAITDLAIGTLPFGLVVTGNDRPGKVARILLTGSGGGEWTIGMGGERVAADAVPDVAVTATTLDWCLLAGERLTPAQFLAAVQDDVAGDRSLVGPLVAAAPAFATL
jgi:uncharacterized protein (TIGR03083 family)